MKYDENVRCYKNARRIIDLSLCFDIFLLDDPYDKDSTNGTEYTVLTKFLKHFGWQSEPS